MRLSLFGTSERYRKSLGEIHSLLLEGKDDSQIVTLLNDNYPAGEIEKVLQYKKDLPLLESYKLPMLILKYILILFLFVKSFLFIIYLSENEIALNYKTITFAFGLLLNIAALIYAYKGLPYFLFAIGVALVSLSNIGGQFNYIISIGLNPNSLVVVLSIALSIIIGLLAWYLSKRVPFELVNFNYVAKEMNLKF
jgi:hypothetical protein